MKNTQPWVYIPWLLELTTQQAPDTDQKQLISTAYLNKEGELPPPCSFYNPTKYCDWRETQEPTLLTPGFTCGNTYFPAGPVLYESLDTDRDSKSSEVPRYHSVKPPCSFFGSSAITLENSNLAYSSNTAFLYLDYQLASQLIALEKFIL